MPPAVIKNAKAKGERYTRNQCTDIKQSRHLSFSQRFSSTISAYYREARPKDLRDVPRQHSLVHLLGQNFPIASFVIDTLRILDMIDAPRLYTVLPNIYLRLLLSFDGVSLVARNSFWALLGGIIPP